MNYRFDGPVSFSSMAAQAFLHFGISYTRDGTASWIFRIQEAPGGWQAALVHEGACCAVSSVCRNRREIAHFLMEQLAGQTGKPLGRWGFLLGMRPVKALYPFLSAAGPWRESAERFLENEKVAPSVRELLMEAAQCQKAVLDQEKAGTTPAALYIHIPFCPSHCAYCSFPAAIVRRGEALDSFTASLCEDIRRAGALSRRKHFVIESIYFGGGTPTILTAAQMERVLDAVRASVPLQERVEWTVEAGRPDTVDPVMLQVLRRHGVNRISINPQTMQDRILAKVSRTHGSRDILRAFREVREAGFPVVNMDFICGLPEQTIADMEENLRVICQLRPENVTIHTLAVKRGSPFFEKEKEWKLPPEHEVEAMLHLTQERLLKEGYHPYYLYRQKYMTDDFANVGYALEGRDSLYNIQMIGEHQHVIGAGAGAVSKAVLPGGFRLKKLYMPRQPGAYEAKLSALCSARDALWDFLPDRKKTAGQES